jgi:hypothetical protein
MDDSSILNGSKGRKENSFKKKAENHGVDDSNVFQPFWLRCTICRTNETDRVLLAYGCNFLLPLGVFLWIVLLASQAI